ncbi:HAD family hydrolase [Halocynthiibacter sp. C4]|uniref:HAD family hydrolase n=1 Tax=Halocynthiibacter sp. C4 TaxID=2992758 RepID=UPI00237A3A18|nr:HAD family hydrolase [Halocynthiibacter sp. C4]MDE0588997.1 HAD family hydrolase [Halocynthiibacter sp. C4]
MAEILGVLFDKDGTLFDFKATWQRWTLGFLTDLSGGDAAKRRALAKAVGFNADTCKFERDSLVVAGTPADIAEALLPHLPGQGREGFISYANQAAARATMIEACPLRPLLRGLSARGLALGVATNDAEAPARAHLRSTGIEDVFDFIAGFDSGFGAKPAPGMCKAFASHTSLKPDQIVMVGDSRHDLLAGRSAGMKTVAVLTGMAKASELEQFADAVLPHVGHLPAWIEAQMPVELPLKSAHKSNGSEARQAPV